MNLVFETGDGAQALEALRRVKPDLAVLDINLPGVGGLDIARARLIERLDFQIVFLTMYRDREIFDEAIDLGVRVYVLKDNSPDEIREALLAAAEGRSWFSRSLADFILNREKDSHTLRKEVAGLDAISKTERKVLKLIAADLSTKEIAESLCLSPRTIDNHRANMSRKLGLSGIHGLLKFAFANRSKL
jgi:DNA-binding NarL/FixJ family response regulator